MCLCQKIETKRVKLSASTCNRSWSWDDSVSCLQQWVYCSPPPNACFLSIHLFLLRWNLNLSSGCNKNYSIKTLNLPPNQNVYQVHTPISGFYMLGLFGILWVSSAPVWFYWSACIGLWSSLPKTEQCGTGYIIQHGSSVGLINQEKKP